MASTVLGDVAPALSLIFGARLTTQIRSVAVLLFLLPVAFGAGKALFWTVEFTGAADAVASAEGVARSSADADAESEVDATLGWAQYDKTSSVTGLAEAATASNYNPESVGTVRNSLLMGRLRAQARRIGLGLARDLYAGNPGATPTELAGAAIAIDSSGVFASINPATFPEWAAIENTHALVDLSFAAIRSKLFTAIYDACGLKPEFCTCPSNVFDKIKEQFGDNELNVSRELMLARGGGPDAMEHRVAKLEAGLDIMSLDGVYIVRDLHATANTLYAWNTEYVMIKQLNALQSAVRPGPDGVLAYFQELTSNPDLRMSTEELEGMAGRHPGVTPHIRVLGDRGDSTEAMMLVYAQVEWTRRNAFGKLTFT